MTNLVDGWTGNVDYQLFGDGSAVNLAGMSVSIIGFDIRGASIAFAGTVSITGESTGKVRFVPAANDIKVTNAPYFIRFKVTDGSGKSIYYPNGEPEKWNIRK